MKNTRTKKQEPKITLDRFTVQAGSLEKIPFVDMNPAYSGGLLLLPGFECPVVIDLEPLNGTEHDQNIPMLRNHDPNREIGHTEKIVIDGYTVHIEGYLSFDNSDVKDIIRTHKLKKKWQVSVGCGGVPESMQRIVPSGETITVNGREFTGPIIIVRTPIREVSFVPAGADLHNSVEIYATSLNGENTMTFEQWAEQHGFDLSGMSEDVLAALKLAFETETGISEESTVDAEGTEQKDDEKDKTVDAEGTGNEDDEEKEKPVNATGVSGQSRKQKKKVPLGIAGAPFQYGDTRPRRDRVIEASLLMSNNTNGRDLERQGFRQSEIDEAMSSDYRGFGLHDYMGLTIKAAGLSYSGRAKSNDHIRTFKRACRRLEERGVSASGMGAGGYTSVNLPGILSNVANKTLLNAYNLVVENGIALRISGIGSSTDFKPVQSFQMDMTGELVVVPDGGNLSHLGFVDTGRSNAVRTRGGIVTLTRQMMINDDLNAFLRIPTQFGQKAAIALEKSVLGTLFSNLTNLFNVANGNIVFNNDLSISGLDAVELCFSEQVGLSDADGNSDFIMVEPKYLLVPPALKSTAKAIYTSTTVNETTATGRPKPVDNPHVGSYDPITSPYLGAKGGLGGTNSNYFLIADPAIIALIEVLFLNGVQTPVIESGETDFDTLGMSWRCYFDYGVGIGDHRAGVLSKSTAS